MATKKKRKCSGKHAREKGAVFERWVAKKLTEAGIEAERGGLFQARFAQSQCVPDVLVDGWWVECKQMSKQSMNQSKALRQAEAEAKTAESKKTPVAVTRINGELQVWCWMRMRDVVWMLHTHGRTGSCEPFASDIIIAIRFEDWLEIVKARK